MTHRANGGDGEIRTLGTRRHDTLARCWFQPLTHVSLPVESKRILKYEIFKKSIL